MYDVIIVGGGVTGCGIARELSRYDLKICLLEKSLDVANGATKANSGLVHAGFDARPGSLKAKLNVESNPMFDTLSRELDFPFKRNGSLVLCLSENSLTKLHALLERGRSNGVGGLQILDGDHVKKLESHLTESVVAALYAPTAGIICPYEFTIALAENAFMNGVEFQFGASVQSIVRESNHFEVNTADDRHYMTRMIINAAGLFADDINNMVSHNRLKIIPRKGEYCLFDKTAGELVTRTVFQLPTELSKGVLVTRTIDGNLLVGPNAVGVNDKEDVSTTSEGLDEVLANAGLMLNEVPLRQIITSFSGVRAHLESNDFLIGEVEDTKNFINVAGIESPGLSSAPAIAKMVAEMAVERLSSMPNPRFSPYRQGIPRFREMNNSQREKLISENPAFGKIVCRCETVTEGEIISAIQRPLGARSLDGIKRRTRAGMGRCQSGFCTPRLIEILSRISRLSYTEITKNGPGSEILIGKNKDL